MTALERATAATELARRLAFPGLTCRCLTVLGHIWQACGDLKSVGTCRTECLELLSSLFQTDATACEGAGRPRVPHRD